MSDRVTQLVRAKVRDMIADVMSDGDVWDQIDDIMRDELKQSSAKLTFTSPPAELAVRVGQEDSDVWIAAPIDLDMAWQAEEVEDVRGALAAVDQMVEALTTLRTALQDRL